MISVLESLWKDLVNVVVEVYVLVDRKMCSIAILGILISFERLEMQGCEFGIAYDYCILVDTLLYKKDRRKRKKKGGERGNRRYGPL